MADFVKISQLTSILQADYNDLLPIVDVSDTAQGAGGSTRNILAHYLLPFTRYLRPTGTSDHIGLNAALLAVSQAGGGEVVCSEGTFDLQGSVLIPSNVMLRGMGWGTIFKLHDGIRKDPFINYDQSNGNSNIILKDFVIDGNASNQAAGLSLEGIDFVLVSNFVIENVWIKNIGTQDTSNTAIGFSLAGACTEGVIAKCRAESNNHYGFNSNNCSHISYVGNISKGNLRHGFGCANGSSNISWVGNKVIDNLMQGFWVRNTSKSAIVGNTVQMPTSSLYGIQLKGNSSEDANLVADQRNTVQGNVVYGPSTYGIYVQNHANYNRIMGNTIENTASDGIFVTANEWNDYLGNTIISATDNGINISGGTSVSINDNFIKLCGKDGILVNAFDSVIQGNKCIDNSTSSSGTYHGIEVSARGRNTIVGNRCYDSRTPKLQGYGIIETNSSNNNVFVGNQTQNNLTGGLSTSGGATISGNNL